ncbi:MAG: hypothetical protein RBS81_07080 [Tenuifilaceae bacterium]|jgi:hypothetical protein|nr:hypothetical protein [Tenuifilaceae bacterium]
MKTKLTLYGLAMAGLTLASCAGSLSVSRSTVTPVDDIYYSPNKSYVVEERVEKPQREMTSSALKMAEIEQKYQEIISQDTTGKIDTVIYKAESTNPYERLMSNSYSESYERRLRGLEDPYYGINNWSVYYSSDYWYASGYDPAFYNVIVMGNQVWVEPNYISSMFIWPRPSWGWSYSWWRPYNSFYTPYWGYSPYAWGYGHGYYDGYWDNHYHHHDNAIYRPRGNYNNTVNSNVNVSNRNRSNDNFVRGTVGTTTRIRPGDNLKTNPNAGTNVVTRRRPNNLNGSNNEITRQRPTRDVSSINETRTRPVRNTDNVKNTENIRERYNPNYNKPGARTRTDYNRPSRGGTVGTPATTRTRNGVTNPAPTRTNNGTPRVYNRPERVNVPTSTRNNNSSERSRNNNSGSSYNRGNSSNTGAARSSSGSNNSSTRSTNTSSNTNSTRTRSR